jgi:hypothetical protein
MNMYLRKMQCLLYKDIKLRCCLTLKHFMIIYEYSCRSECKPVGGSGAQVFFFPDEGAPQLPPSVAMTNLNSPGYVQRS